MSPQSSAEIEFVEIDQASSPIASGSIFSKFAQFKLPVAVMVACIIPIACMAPDWQAQTVAVKGHVSVNGESPTGAIIFLHPVNGTVDSRASRPSGIVADDGSYVLTTYEYGDGGPAGEYIFTIYWPVDPKLGNVSPDRLNRKYSSAEKSTLKISIPPKGGELQAIAIDNAKLTNPTPARPTGSPM